jgi:hypothetical protein
LSPSYFFQLTSLNRNTVGDGDGVDHHLHGALEGDLLQGSPYAFVHCRKKVTDFPVPSRDVTSQPNSPWPGIIQLFPAREILVIDIPAGDRKIANLLLQCNEIPFNLVREFNTVCVQ